MSDASTISWTDATWNPVTGCTWASPGCDNCYAATMTRRLEAMGQEKYAGLTTHKHFNGVLKTHLDALSIPLKWKKPRRVFVNSMSDLFHKDVPDQFIDSVFAVMALANWHTFQVLTKRPERMAEYINGRAYGRWCDIARVIECKRSARNNGYPLQNVWLGTSVESQSQTDRIEHLRKCPAAVRFLSLEPLLGPMENILLEGIDWVIVGG